MKKTWIILGIAVIVMAVIAYNTEKSDAPTTNTDVNAGPQSFQVGAGEESFLDPSNGGTLPQPLSADDRLLLEYLQSLVQENHIPTPNLDAVIVLINATKSERATILADFKGQRIAEKQAKIQALDQEKAEVQSKIDELNQ